ncbi:MAG TPA: diguanylate cyclase, partial [bacterium]
APIRLKDDSIIGVINVEKIPFFHFNIHTVKTFEVLSQWLSVVVEKALRFKKFQDQNIDDEITGAYSYPYFQKRLMYEIARARRFMTPLSLLLVEIEQFEFMRAADRRNLLVVLKWVFANILREIDLIARYKTDGVLAIILPGQTSSGAEAVANRLTIEIQNYRLRPFHNGEELLTLNFGLSTLLSTEGAYATLIASAEERLQNDGIRGGTGIFGDLRYLLNAALKDGEPLPTGKPL